MDLLTYTFAMQLVEDSLQAARRWVEAYEATPKHDLNRILALIKARAWVRAARKNLGIAEAELTGTPRILKPLRARVVKGVRS